MHPLLHSFSEMGTILSPRQIVSKLQYKQRHRTAKSVIQVSVFEEIFENITDDNANTAC